MSEGVLDIPMQTALNEHKIDFTDINKIGVADSLTFCLEQLDKSEDVLITKIFACASVCIRHFKQRYVLECKNTGLELDKDQYIARLVDDIEYHTSVFDGDADPQDLREKRFDELNAQGHTFDFSILGVVSLQEYLNYACDNLVDEELIGPELYEAIGFILTRVMGVMVHSFREITSVPRPQQMINVTQILKQQFREV